jgi:hypothetical protein
LGIPIVNQVAHACFAARISGRTTTTNVIWENLVDSKTVELTANDNTIYNFMWVDTKGPRWSSKSHPGFSVWSTTSGIAGWPTSASRAPTRAKGGKYLMLPPGYKGDVPAGYHVVRPNTYGNWLVFRAFVVDGSPKPGVESVKKNLKIYRLSDAANPPAMKFVNGSGLPSNFVAPGDYAFWTLLNQVIQEEPSQGSDPTTLGFFASIGIVKGQPFAPDERMKKILTDAANIGAVTARTVAYKMRVQGGLFLSGQRLAAPLLWWL